MTYGISLTDAFQLAVALQTRCDGFLTNDRQLSRVRELNILLIDDLRTSD